MDLADWTTTSTCQPYPQFIKYYYRTLFVLFYQHCANMDFLITYLKTKFARFLMLQVLSSIMINKDVFMFVPMQDFSKPWTDEELYEKYDLTEDEINFIESMIKPME